MKQVFDLLNETKLLTERKSSNAEETDHVERTTDLAFLLFVTGHFNKLNEQQKRKNKRAADLYNINAFQGKNMQKYSHSVPFLRGKFHERCQDFEITEPQLLLFT